MPTAATPASTPPPAELFSVQQLATRHPHLLSVNRLQWAVRQRRKNGLAAARVVFDSPCGQLFIHEPAFLAWFLGLSGRSKPRALRARAIRGAPH